MAETFRYFVVLHSVAHPDLHAKYFENDRKGIEAYIAGFLSAASLADPPFTVTALPSQQVGSSIKGEEPRKSTKLVVSLDVRDKSTVHSLRDAVASPQNRNVFVGSSPDIPFVGTDHWCPSEATDPIFANRADAERLCGIDYLKSRNGTMIGGKKTITSGAGVNIAIVDQGLNMNQLGNSYGGGWCVGNTQPGTTNPPPGTIHRSHGMMIAHNIHQVAKDAKFFDLPLVPWNITNIPVFLSLAYAAFTKMLDEISVYRSGNGNFSGPWILINPWGIFDTRSEYPSGDYTNNPNNCFNLLVASAVRSGIDVIFAAGNCGQFCPDWRCGPTDVGPGHSIWGANSLSDVLTVGAVRADTIWLGYSSQGPGQANLDPAKPDLCAPSQFCESDDASSLNTGTSAACAIAAGVVAALRSNWNSATVSPAQLKSILNNTSRKPPGLQQGNPLSHRFGNGILDAKAAFSNMPGSLSEPAVTALAEPPATTLGGPPGTFFSSLFAWLRGNRRERA